MEAVAKQKKLELFTSLLKVRRVEERLIDLITKGIMPGWLHPVLGQEAVGIGVTANLERTDYVNNTHRGRDQIVGKGVPIKRFMTEFLGKKNGPCGGIAGEMHYCDVEYGILGPSGCMGANLPIAVGVALASQYRNTRQVVACILGDGTLDNGYFHESVNIASKWKLPIVL